MKPVFYVPLPFHINVAQQCSYDNQVKNIESALELLLSHKSFRDKFVKVVQYTCL